MFREEGLSKGREEWRRHLSPSRTQRFNKTSLEEKKGVFISLTSVNSCDMGVLDGVQMLFLCFVDAKAFPIISTPRSGWLSLYSQCNAEFSKAVEVSLHIFASDADR